MMRTGYLFYYFSPLARFWFLVVYFVLKIGRHQNWNLYFLIGKLFRSAVLTTAFTMIPGVMEFVALIPRYTCAMSWNMKELRFRLFLYVYNFLFWHAFCLSSVFTQIRLRALQNSYRRYFGSHNRLQSHVQDDLTHHLPNSPARLLS